MAGADVPGLGSLDPHSDRPIWMQIADQLRAAIESGGLDPGDLLSSSRVAGADVPGLGSLDPHSDRPIYKQIADQLRAAIQSGELDPGDLLPSEADLMGHYEVARATVRQATGLLKAEGLAVAVHGRGLFVADATPAPTITGMSFSFAAGGTRAQTLDELAKVTREHDQAAATIADLLVEMVGAGPLETSDGKPVIYQVTAFGHTARGKSRDDWPSLSVALSCVPGKRPDEG